jgi:hypothetical protein
VAEHLDTALDRRALDDIVEVLPDGQADFEGLAGQRVAATRVPAWLARWTALRARVPVRSMAVGAAVVGLLLAADGPGTVYPSYLYGAGDQCPKGVPCTEYGRVRQDMWASFNALFVDARITTGRVWFDPTTDVVYSQVLTARQPNVMIKLSQLRTGTARPEDAGPPAEFDVPQQWQRRLMPRTVIISLHRGAWLLTATVRGPWEGRLPLLAARRWGVSASLPE